MAINMSAIEQAARKIAMDALESGVRAGCEYLSLILQAKVSSGHSLPTAMRGPVGKNPFKYRRGATETTKAKWEASPPEWAGAPKSYGGAPGVVSGEGRKSIGYQIIERNDAAGTIRVLIGGDSPENNSKGGFNTLPGYMTGHELGIAYPTNPKSTKPKRVVQRPWLRNTVDEFWGPFTDMVIRVAGIS